MRDKIGCAVQCSAGWGGGGREGGGLQGLMGQEAEGGSGEPEG